MTNYTPDHLTNLLTTDREKLTRICAEVCYGWRGEKSYADVAVDWVKPNGDYVCGTHEFNPLEDSEKGRSQAFELAVKFDCFPYGLRASNQWCVQLFNLNLPNLICEDPQAAIVIASILTAQQENNDEWNTKSD